MSSYDHKAIEKKWQDFWNEKGLHNTPTRAEGKDNFYLLVEFPYPSGNLHIGHWYAFAVPDIFARKKRMEGYNVLFPIGFDAFGLPAENAAIKRNLDPKKWTYENIAHMQKQIASIGASFDLSRTVISSDPEYYRWTQWLFLEFYKKGLAYRKKAEVNWCPSCKTVLANEQVKEGKCDRCESDVEKKNLEQWFFKITDYSERLLSDLDSLDWPEEIKSAQRNWIDKSDGSQITFTLTHIDADKTQKNAEIGKVDIFTTRADTLFGATYVVLAPEHKLVSELKSKIKNWSEVDAYVKKAGSKKDLDRLASVGEKTGIEIKGIKAINPASGEEIPVWVADYVLSDYGTGAVMGVPSHDKRDFEFSTASGLNKIAVVIPEEKDVLNKDFYPSPGLIRFDSDHKLEDMKKIKNLKLIKELKEGKRCFTGSGKLVNSGDFNDMKNIDAIKPITEKVNGEFITKYKLRDWLLSRQRYWGTPIPIVYDPEGNPQPIPEKHLPWTLPEDVDFTPTGEAPLAKSKELLERTEKIFGKGWKPEIDTMDTFVDSSWYFLRYLDPKNEKEFCSKDVEKNWMPVNQYSGGAEHTTMHLLYSRFFHKALFDMGLVKDKEPYIKRMNRGLILGPDGKKMSKSKGNVIDPDENVSYVGADSVRMYLAFIGPYNEVGSYPWDIGGIAGIKRFLERIWRLQEALTSEGSTDVEKLLHATIKKVGEDIESFKFNTAVSSLMMLLNKIESENKITKSQYETLLKILAPFSPHIAEEIWHILGNENSIHQEDWPKFDSKMLINNTAKIAVQVDGKVRSIIEMPTDSENSDVEKTALESDEVKKWIEKQNVDKVFHVKNKLVSFVSKKL